MKQSFKYQENSYALGPFIKCPCPEMIEATGISGFDFAVVDMEHTPLGPRDLYPLVLAAERRGLRLVVRIPANEEKYFKWCLDLGIQSIQVPHIQTVEDVKAAVESSYFFPQGERGLCRFVRAANFSHTEKQDYLKQANSGTHLIIQIEGQKGLSNLDSILKVEGIGTVFIGPYDLSQSMGKPGMIWDPSVVAAMQKIIRSCQDLKINLGTFTDTEEGVKFWAKAGVKLIQYASDLNLYLSSVANLKKSIETE